MDLVQFEDKLKKESWDVSIPKTVLHYYKNKEIDRDYACYLLKNIEENSFNRNYRIQSIIFYCKLQKKNKELFKYLEFNVISSRDSDTKLLSILIGKRHFEEKMTKILESVFKNKERFLEYIAIQGTYNDKTLLLEETSRLFKIPILRLYIHYRYFFDNNGLRFNVYQYRIFGRYHYFHGNLNFKIQSYDGIGKIYDLKDKTIILEDYNYSQIKERDILETELNTAYYMKIRKTINIYDINEKYCFVISEAFFRTIIKKINRLFELEPDDYFFSFIRNNTVYFLYIDVPAIQLEILIPAKRCKK